MAVCNFGTLQHQQHRHFATLALCNIGTFNIGTLQHQKHRLFGTLQHWHFAFLALCNFGTLQLWHVATLAPCNFSTLQYWHFSNLELCNFGEPKPSYINACIYASISTSYLLDTNKDQVKKQAPLCFIEIVQYIYLSIYLSLTFIFKFKLRNHSRY